MTDDLSASSDEDLPLGSTSEPLASPADQAWISGLLGGLKSGDASIPADVSARLDRALTDEELLRSTAGQTVATSAPGVGRGTSTMRWLAVAAAAVAVVGAGTLFAQSMSTAPGGTTNVANGPINAENSQSAAQGQAPTDTKVLAQADRSISKATVGTEVTALLAAAQPDNLGAAGTSAGGSAGGSAGSSVPPLLPSGSAVSSSAGVLDAASPWSDCLIAVTGSASTPAKAVITGIVYEGQSADIIVRAVSGDTAHLDVWVVAAGCSRSQARVLHHEVISAA